MKKKSIILSMVLVLVLVLTGYVYANEDIRPTEGENNPRSSMMRNAWNRWYFNRMGTVSEDGCQEMEGFMDTLDEDDPMFQMHRAMHGENRFRTQPMNNNSRVRRACH